MKPSQLLARAKSACEIVRTNNGGFHKSGASRLAIGERNCAGLLTCLAAVALVLFSRFAESCPFCSSPSLTLSEQIAQADVVVLVKWLRGQAAKISDAGSTEFEIVEVAHQPDGGKLVKGGKINLIRYRPAKAGDLFMLFGTKVELGGRTTFEVSTNSVDVGRSTVKLETEKKSEETNKTTAEVSKPKSDSTIEWGSPLEVSQAAYEYIRNSPKPGLLPVERLKYFVKYLETGDHMISDDAFGEFANAAYADVAKLAPDLPRDNLRKWLNSKDVAPSRMGVYGMMLGLCGNADDAKLLEEKIFVETGDYRLGIDGIMGGYLLRTGAEGLALLEEKKLMDKKALFSETYSAMQAIRFMWQYGGDRISADRLRQSMRMLLDRPELADLVISDLSRMKDWSVMDKLMSIYDDEANIPSVKRAIVRYMLSSIKDNGEKKQGTAGGGDSEPPTESPAHVLKGKKCLEELELKDPKTVNEAKRFFR